MSDNPGAGKLWIPDETSALDEDQVSDDTFLEELMETMMKPIDPDAPNTSCMHGPGER